MSTPSQVETVFRGDLDRIVMKALEKDRTRRYETANGLAREVQRFLNDEPVEACPPSTGYRLRKLLRNHRTGVLTAAVGVLLLVAGAAGSIQVPPAAQGLITAALVRLVQLYDAWGKQDEAEKWRKLLPASLR